MIRKWSGDAIVEVHVAVSAPAGLAGRSRRRWSTRPAYADDVRRTDSVAAVRRMRPLRRDSRGRGVTPGCVRAPRTRRGRPSS
jgi:hypothetical protein